MSSSSWEAFEAAEKGCLLNERFTAKPHNVVTT